MKTKFIIFEMVFVLIFMACSHNKDSRQEISNIVEDYAEKGLFNGSLAIVKDGEVLYEGHFGYANMETKDTLRSTTLFPIASLTKQFTASAIMLLQERGVLDVENKLSKFIEVPPHMRDVTLSNLMNMTSGLFNYTENGVFSNKDSVLSFHFKCDSLFFPTNSRYYYNNSNYIFLSLVIEKISGISYANFIKENIFIPLGMSASFVYQGGKIDKAVGYNEDGKVYDELITTADGGIISNIEDMILWDKALYQNKLLKEDTRDAMFQAGILENGKESLYGFGWEIGPLQKSLFNLLIGKYDGVVSHTGGLSSFGAYNQLDTNNGLSFILLTNQKRLKMRKMVSEINKVLLNL